MAEERVTFKSKGHTLAGVVRIPAGARERRPAFIVLHGFGSNLNSSNVLEPCAMFEKLGYVTLRFDMPGCGESEGEKGRLICLEQVGAVREALSLLAQPGALRAGEEQRAQRIHGGSGLLTRRGERRGIRAPTRA